MPNMQPKRPNIYHDIQSDTGYLVGSRSDTRYPTTADARFDITPDRVIKKDTQLEDRYPTKLDINIKSGRISVKKVRYPARYFARSDIL